MTVKHSTLTGADLHEPKGVASATADQVYLADGAASGAWDFPEYVLQAEISDISTPQSVFIVAPYAGTIESITSVIDGAIATSDAVLSFEIGGTPVTDGNITVAFTASAAGDVDSSTPSAANALTAGQALECITDGASTNTVAVKLTFVIKRTS